MKFFNELIDMNSSKNSKIFLGLIFALAALILIFSKAYFLPEINIELIYICGGLSTSYLFQGIFTKNNTNPNPE